MPNGSSIKIAHIEYVRDGKWAPEVAGELAGKAITYSPAAPAGYSYHGDEVGRVFYGSSSSIIPGVSQIRAFEAWNYFDSSLNTAKGIAPAAADWDVENHSYISSSGLTTNEGGRRLDFRIDRDGVTATVVLENGTGVVPPLFGNTYNTIVVGSSTGSHSLGGTTREVNGRLKPDIVGTANWTSYAGPIVGSSAGLLIAKTKADTSLAMAKRPEVIKALLMAGATKDEFPSWSRSSTAPIDPIYGAGEVNVNNSYGILVAGRQPASSSSIRSSRGWDLNSAGQGSSLHYFFTIGSGQTGTVSAVLTWHRNVSPINGAWNQGVSASVDNLDLRLYRADPQFQVGDLLQDSVSSIDNVEHVFLRDLAEGTYALVVSSVSGSKQFGLAWNVSGVTSQPPTVTAPAITTQPVAKTVSEGSSASFSVAASGTSPFTYQWKKDGGAISGATGSSFSITSATLANAGTYTVVVSNSAGSATSNGAFLTVNSAVTAPAITSQPSAASASEGGSATFSVSASGTSPFNYQWRKDGVAISGATGSSFSITSATLANAGTYSVVVSNSAGSATSNGAYLTINSSVVAPTITTQPSPASAIEGGSATFNVSASGTSPFSYQWRKDGVAISGATASSLLLSSLTLAQSGTYSVVVSNSAGSATSNGASLTLSASVAAPTITTQPAAISVIEGSSVSFNVSASGTSPFNYQWRKNGVAISGATGSTFSITSATLANAGTYTVVVSNSAGSATSNGASLTINSSVVAPTITTQPSPKSVAEGATVSFSVIASGTAPFTYQWQRNSVAIVGANGSSFSIAAVTLADGGSYSVVVTNSAGSASSSAAFLTVNVVAAVAPSITTQPSPVSAIEGGNATFNVSASGTSPFTYQWRKDGVAISGATGSSFSITSATLANAGTYTVVVSNSAGSATSNGASLTVSASVASPTITTQPAAISVIDGSSASFSVTASGTSPFNYQWRKNGVAISGATGSSFSITSATLANAGTYS
ncbi:MAG TPA: immunoglobulin domain-containing protein, partial [Opitutaceae bacterium]|nr:immunoglobulin domain-containing protein [Opitutaceae bacterium]